MTAQAPLELRICHEPDAAVIAAFGEIDLSSSPALREHLLTSFEYGATVLDLAGVGFCDMAGLRVLVETERLARASGIAFRLAAVSPAVSRAIELAGAGELFEVLADVESAYKECDRGLEGRDAGGE